MISYPNREVAEKSHHHMLAVSNYSTSYFGGSYPIYHFTNPTISALAKGDIPKRDLHLGTQIFFPTHQG